MLRETAETLHRSPDFLPLGDCAGIVEGNALRKGWRERFSVLGKSESCCIVGNPPFVGARNKSAEQARDVEIDYAWRTFRWDNESFDKAHVHVVIIGFHCGRAACPQAAATAVQRNAVSSWLRGVRDNAPYRFGGKLTVK